MRRALGLYGQGTHPRVDHDRTEPASRSLDRFGSSGHRRRFVQDGEVPVTVVRREGSSDPLAHRPPANAAMPPQQSRLQRTEAALAAETAARQAAERALADAHAMVRDLQTKIGHAELARSEAVEAARRERETVAATKSDLQEHSRLLTEAHEQIRVLEESLETVESALAEERAARQAAETSQRFAEEARDNAERLLQELTNAAELDLPRAPSAPATGRTVVRRDKELGAGPVGRNRTAPVAEAEPEPVKWWLLPAPTAKRR